MCPRTTLRPSRPCSRGRAGEIAAFIGEPVIGAGVVIPPVEGYWQAVSRLCREHEVLLIADEVITGFGRTGRWWGTERVAIEPDMITFAKGVTSGYVPLGGVLVGRRLREPFWDTGSAVFRHGYTYSGHAGACAAAMANIDILEREKLVERVRELEHVLAAAVGELRDTTARRRDPDGGPDGGSRPSRRTSWLPTPPFPERVVAAALRHGVVTRVLRGHAIQISRRVHHHGSQRSASSSRASTRRSVTLPPPESERAPSPER